MSSVRCSQIGFLGCLGVAGAGGGAAKLPGLPWARGVDAALSNSAARPSTCTVYWDGSMRRACRLDWVYFDPTWYLGLDIRAPAAAAVNTPAPGDGVGLALPDDAGACGGLQEARPRAAALAELGRRRSTGAAAAPLGLCCDRSYSWRCLGDISTWYATFKDTICLSRLRRSTSSKCPTLSGW